MERSARPLVAVTLVSLVMATRAVAQGPGQFESWKGHGPAKAPKAACRDLRSLTGYDLSIDFATLVPVQGDVPEFCQVQGLIAPEVRFEVALPTAWNGRLYMTGNGGFAGEGFSASYRVGRRNLALTAGFAVAMTNTGHDAAREPLATFAAHPQKLADYAYRAVHVTALSAKELARAYYSAPPQRSYFDGCSTGGRQGLISAQRFPDDFDGIVVGAPVLDFSRTMVQAALIQRALTATPLSSAKLRLLGEKVLAKCDDVDGLADGLLDDPRRCAFDPAADLPRCAEAGEACFTEAEAKAVQAVYAGVTSRGTKVFPGFALSSEAPVAGSRSGWEGWIVPRDGQPTTSLRFAESFFKHMATPGTEIDWRAFDPDRDLDKLKAISTLLDATDPDLGRFRARGGKIVMYFGWADPALTPLMGVDYYERVRQAMGPGTAEFFRLFMMPGVLHCAGGPGPDVADTLTPLVEWVERGIAPDRIVAARKVDGKVVRTRPLCPYPSVARRKGTGSPDDAAGFICSDPAPR